MKAKEEWKDVERTETLFADIIEFLPDATFAIDIQGKVTAWNQAMVAMTGVKAEHILGKGDYEYAKCFYGCRRPILIDLALRWDDTIALTYQFIRKENDILTSRIENPPLSPNPSVFWNTARKLYNGDGECIGAIEVIRDFTGRALSKKALQESEQRLRLALQGSPVVVWEQDLELRYTWIYNLQGLSSETVVGKTDCDLMRAEDAAVIEALKLGVIRTGKRAREEVKIESRDRVRWWDLSIEPNYGNDQRIIGIRCAATDVTQRKFTEQALRDTEERFRLFMDNSPTIAWMKDAGGRYVYLSKAGKKILDIPAHWQGKTDAELLPAGMAENFRKNDQAVLDYGYMVETTGEIINPDGSRKYWLNSKFPFRDAAGKRYVGGIGLDITAHKRAEDRLARQTKLIKGISRIFQQAMICKTEAQLGRICMEVAEEATGSEFSLIGDVDPKGELFNIRISDQGQAACRMEGSLGNLRVGADMNGLCGQVRREGKSFFTNDTSIYLMHIDLPQGHPPLNSFLAAPLLHNDKVIGLVAVANNGSYSAEEQQILEALAGAIVQALLHKRAEEGLKRAHDELEKKVSERTAELELRNRDIRELAHKAIFSIESDRKAISKDLHDSIGGSLAAIKHLTEFGLTVMPPDTTEARSTFERVVEHLAATIKETRRITKRLRPTILDDFGLVVAMRDTIREFCEVYPSIEVHPHFQILQEKVSNEIDTVLYRVVQESLNNVGKHSQATNVHIHLHRDSQRVCLKIDDDGCGFNADEALNNVKPLTGYGLQSMKERVEICKGSFQIRSTAGQGTTIDVAFPLNSKEQLPMAHNL